LHVWKHRLTPYFALSRTPHGVLDMAAPALAALLSLGQLPPVSVMVVGLITVFAGYTAVYALNDLVDLRTDRKKAKAGVFQESGNDLDGVMVRHPMAKGVLSFGAGLAWACGWAFIAMAGAYWLNPVCLAIFVAGGLLESLYCKLWQVTPLRTLVNGAVKTLGPVAAVFAVNPAPSPLFLTTLFLWFFLWEIGGQNIPNDWMDIEEDRHFKARTVPIHLGLDRSMVLITACLAAVLVLNFLVFWVSPLRFGMIQLFIAVGVNILLLLYPAYLLGERRKRQQAMDLFNRASYYPVAMLGVVVLQFIF
jgi:4-hydroxybenzoate polyprenyltransferase